MINNIDHSSAHITLKINIPDKGIYEVRLLLHLCFVRSQWRQDLETWQI